MDHPSSPPNQLMSLPLEVLQLIYSYAEIPQLSHVCRTFRQNLPTFTIHTRQAAEAAFAMNPSLQEQAIFDLVNGINPSQFLERSYISRLHEVNDNHSLAQGLICESWMTVSMLQKLRTHLVQRLVGSIYEAVGATFPRETRSMLEKFLADNQKDHFSPGWSLPYYKLISSSPRLWKTEIAYRRGSIRVIVVKNCVLISASSARHTGLVLQPLIPAHNLIEWIAQRGTEFDLRSYSLAQELFPPRLHSELNR